MSEAFGHADMHELLTALSSAENPSCHSSDIIWYSLPPLDEILNQSKGTVSLMQDILLVDTEVHLIELYSLI